MKDDKWLITRTRFIPAVYPLLAFFDWKFEKYFDISDSGHVLNIWENGNYYAVWDKAKYAEFGEHSLSKLLGIGDMKKVRAISDKTGESLIQFCKKYAESTSTLTIDEHIKFIDELTTLYSALMKDNMCYWLFTPQVLEKKIKILLKSFTDEQVNEIIYSLSHPSEISYSQSIEKEFSSLVSLSKSEGIDSENLKKRVHEFSSKYFWFPYEYVGPDIWDTDSVFKRISTEASKLNSIAVNQDHDISIEQAKIVKKYNLSQGVVTLFKIWQAMSLLQDDRKKINAQVSFYINDIISKKAAKAFNITFEQARYLDKSILTILKNNRDEFEKEMNARMQLYVVDEKNNGHLSFSSDDAQKYLKSLGIKIKEDIVNTKEVRGQIAYKGKVIGRVRVLKTSQVPDFVDGEVIVTGMTTPDFAPLIKRASAIVTNEGGITCHAAIVSRELKKPCIIGTKIATQVFKDGDMVEVDADNGIVKIL